MKTNLEQVPNDVLTVFDVYIVLGVLEGRDLGMKGKGAFPGEGCLAALVKKNIFGAGLSKGHEVAVSWKRKLYIYWNYNRPNIALWEKSTIKSYKFLALRQKSK